MFCPLGQSLITVVDLPALDILSLHVLTNSVSSLTAYLKSVTVVVGCAFICMHQCWPVAVFVRDVFNYMKLVNIY